ncbi:AEC family transporter [Corynebacterium glyciniphilum]|uniref:AEC family transporter n=1 Tax=Corynebacterium glyciniphilum TaxID=1404244 RepID=UPI0026525502|nr:AEC family transporter [Corynebacterium glyciniphilum]MDN5683522.1 AEC family transporter [Corynebacterium glyciniphilum]MDN6705534.1 AEC family transporter [Corynebacterium glyciniphilum]
MLNVLSGFMVVVIIIALGYLVGRRGLLGPNAVYSLNMFVFYLATPALLINFLRDADLATVFGDNLAVVVISTLTAGLLGFLGYRFLARRPVSDSLVTMLACSYCNGSNLGIPIATHVLDDPAASLPVIIFQVAFYGPATVLLLDVTTRSAGTGSPGTGSLGPLVRELVLGIVRNPLIIAATVGIVLSLLHTNAGWELPEMLAEPVSLLAAGTVPAALVAFGLSMAEVTVLDRDTSPRRSVWMASLVKTVGHPLIAYLAARLIFDATGPALLAFVVVAALPSAQNVFTYSQRFGVNTVLARDTAVISTMLSIPSIAVITVLLG